MEADFELKRKRAAAEEEEEEVQLSQVTQCSAPHAKRARKQARPVRGKGKQQMRRQRRSKKPAATSPDDQPPVIQNQLSPADDARAATPTPPKAPTPPQAPEPNSVEESWRIYNEAPPLSPPNQPRQTLGSEEIRILLELEEEEEREEQRLREQMLRAH